MFLLVEVQKRLHMPAIALASPLSPFAGGRSRGGLPVSPSFQGGGIVSQHPSRCLNCHPGSEEAVTLLRLLLVTLGWSYGDRRDNQRRRCGLLKLPLRLLRLDLLGRRIRMGRGRVQQRIDELLLVDMLPVVS